MNSRLQDNFYRYLTSDGRYDGGKQATGDHTPARFYVGSPGRVITINRLIVHISDAANPSSDEYGNLGAALTNGIAVNVKDVSGTVVLDLTDALPIKTNADWGRVCYDVQLTSFGAGNDFIQVRWTFAKSGRPLTLPPGYTFGVDLNDDFTGLDGHTFMAQGHYGPFS